MALLDSEIFSLRMLQIVINKEEVKKDFKKKGKKRSKLARSQVTSDSS